MDKDVGIVTAPKGTGTALTDAVGISAGEARAKLPVLSIDIETFSEIDLSKCGLHKYVEDDSFEILILAYAFDDEKVQVVDMANHEPVPEKVRQALEDQNIIKAAWNAEFERTALSKYVGHTIAPEGWHCTMVLAESLSLPAGLGNAAEVLRADVQKDKRGEALIKYFSQPCKPTGRNGMRTRNLPHDDPEGWEVFKEYCKTDVSTERAIREKLDQFPMSDEEWKAYCVDQRINDRGVLLDRQLIAEAIQCDLILTEEMTKRAYELTGLENPNSVSQLKSWLDERGIEVPSLGKKEVQTMIDSLEKSGSDQEVLEMLKLRLLMAKSSVKKYQAADRCACRDNRARGLFRFNGASRTCRFSSRYLQLQNLKRNSIATLDEARELVKMGQFQLLDSIYGNVPDILSQLVRTMLIPKEGCEFIVADFSAIEARTLAWITGENWVLQAFMSGQDIYCQMASKMFGVPVVKHGINGELRQKGKIAVLACGYSGSVGALKAMGALDMGLKEEDLQPIVDSYREANPKIVSFWWDIERACRDTVSDHRTREVQRITVSYSYGTLWITLPSGRRMPYIKPKITAKDDGRMELSGEGVGIGNHWCRQPLYGGLLTENICQATARDILVEAMKRFDARGMDIVAHIHDEVILEVPRGKYTVEEVCSIMCEHRDWYQDLPLSADGYKGNYYFKD